MQTGEIELPCGCEARKEIMFTRGELDWTCIAVLVAIPAAVYLTARLLS